MADGNDIRIEIWDESGTTQLNTTYTSTSGNTSCAGDFTGTLNTPYQFSPGLAGTYQIRLFNNSGNGSAGVFSRFDVTVTPDVATVVDPKLNQGRLWAYRWAFRCTAGNVCFGADYATSANLYAVVDGGFSDSYYVWQLNLDNFAGYAYELTANNTGLESPNADGDVVAGFSACIDANDDPANGCSSVSGNRNEVLPLYPIYTSDPLQSYPRPATLPEITDFSFLDDAGVDDSISPSETLTIQDTGNFTFTTNLITSGTYQIIIDLNQNGSFGAGDVYLNGEANPGSGNSVNWNGKDNNGVSIPNGSYNAQIALKVGEFHFTAADAETSGGPGNPGLTINAVLDSGVVDTSNKVFWDDSTVLLLAGPTAFNRDGAERHHNWGTFSGSGDGNRAFLDTYVVGASSAPVVTRIEVEPADTPKAKFFGEIFDDLNSNGVRDTGEPPLANITVAITEQTTGITFYVSTNSAGVYTGFTHDSAIFVDIDETTFPADYVQTAGQDQETIVIVTGSDTNLGADGFHPPSISIAAQSVCIQDAPYVEYDITAVGFVPNNLATVEWIGANGVVVQTLNNQPLTGARLLWPEAAVDGAGNGSAWPGWDFVAGEWIQVSSQVRPQLRVRVSVNPTNEVTLSYPPATPACSANPPPPVSPASPPPAPTGGQPSSGGSNVVSVPLLPLPALFLLIAAMGLVGGRAFGK